MLKGHGADLQSPAAQWEPGKWNHKDGLIMRCMVTSGGGGFPLLFFLVAFVAVQGTPSREKG